MVSNVSGWCVLRPGQLLVWGEWRLTPQTGMLSTSGHSAWRLMVGPAEATAARAARTRVEKCILTVGLGDMALKFCFGEIWDCLTGGCVGGERTPVEGREGGYLCFSLRPSCCPVQQMQRGPTTHPSSLGSWLPLSSPSLRQEHGVNIVCHDLPLPSHISIQE